jgi:hypothetical protein
MNERTRTGRPAAGEVSHELADLVRDRRVQPPSS